MWKTVISSGQCFAELVSHRSLWERDEQDKNKKGRLLYQLKRCLVSYSCGKSSLELRSVFSVGSTVWILSKLRGGQPLDSS